MLDRIRQFVKDKAVSRGRELSDGFKRFTDQDARLERKKNYRPSNMSREELDGMMRSPDMAAAIMRSPILGMTSSLPVRGAKMLPSMIDDMILAKKPFKLGGQASDDIASSLRGRNYMQTMDDVWRPSPTPPQVSKMNPRQLNYADLAEIQQPNPAAIEHSMMRNRPIAEAIGLQSKPAIGAGGPNKAIRPMEGLATYIPPETLSQPQGLRNMFSGGINAGKYAPDDNVFIMSARNNNGYTKPNIAEMVAAIKGKAKTIVTEAAGVDANPLTDVDTAVDRLLVNAGYRTNEPGIWTLADKKDWLRFTRNPAKQVLPTGNIPQPRADLRLPEYGYAGPTMLRNGAERPNMPRDYYDSSIIDDYLPLFHKKPKR